MKNNQLRTGADKGNWNRREKSHLSPIISSLNPSFQHCLFGSLAGAAHLLNFNTGVLKKVPLEQKSNFEYKGISFLY